MDKCNLTPYEGDKPYIFVSYAHKDSDKVYPILDELADRGYRIWYDDGIAPGSEWPEYIAEHLNGSDVVMAFISPNSIASPNCRREVTFALSKKKEFLAVMLEETEMSLGMEMQLSAQQCVMKQNYKVENEFYDKLCNAPGLAVCNGFSGKIKESSRFDVPASSRENAITAEDMKTVERMEAAVDKSLEKEEVPYDNKYITNAAPKSRKKSKVPVVLLAILGVLIALIAGGKIVKSATSIHLPDGTAIAKNETSILIKDTTISDSNLKKIGKLKKLGSITMKNCEIQGDFDSLENLGSIRNLNLEKSELKEYGFLSEMTGLRTLNLSGHANFDDAELIPTDNLTELILDGTAIKDIGNICECTSLVKLSLSNTQVCETAGTFNSLRLKELNLEGLSGLKSLAAFENLTILEKLNVSGCGATNISWIAGNKETLSVINVSNTSIDEDTYAAIGMCDKLSELYLDGTSTESLYFLGNTENLTVLHASGCGMTDAGAVAQMTNLQKLWLDRNNLHSIDLHSLSELKEINLAHNQITELSGLPSEVSIGAVYVAIYDNPADLGTMPMWPTCTGALMTDYSDRLLDEANISPFGRLYVIGTPANKQVELEDEYHSKLKMVSYEELEKMINDSDSLSYANWTE